MLNGHDHDKRIVRKLQNDGSHPFDLMIFCPGCRCGRGINAYLPREPRWEFDGNYEKPTFSPSLLVRHGPGGSIVCHSFIRNGNIEFLMDCTHELAGKSVRLEPF